MPIKNMVILDLPCGPGDYVRKYFKAGAAKVIAIDVVPFQIKVSQKRDKKTGYLRVLWNTLFMMPEILGVCQTC